MREALLIRSIRHANVMNANDYFRKLYGSVVRRPVAPAFIAIHLLTNSIARTGSNCGTAIAIMFIIWLVILFVILLVIMHVIWHVYLRNLSNVRNKINT